MQKTKADIIFKRLLRIWTGMKTRCNNENSDHYNRYGGRGIVGIELLLPSKYLKENKEDLIIQLHIMLNKLRKS